MRISWKKIILVAVGIYVAVVFVSLVALVLVARFAPDAAPSVDENGFTAFIGGSGATSPASSIDLEPIWAPTLGPVDAKVTIVEFADFQCPYCRASALPIRQLIAAHPNDIRLVFRQFPVTSLHPLAARLAEYSLCAHDQGKFWSFHDRVYLSTGELTDNDLDALAESVGLNEERFNRCIISGQFKDAVQQDLADVISIGGRGTPTWVVNGQKIEGYHSYETWERIVGELLR